MQSFVKKYCSTSDNGAVSLFFLLDVVGRLSSDFICARTSSYFVCSPGVSSTESGIVDEAAGASNGSFRAAGFDVDSVGFGCSDAAGSSFSSRLR